MGNGGNSDAAYDVALELCWATVRPAGLVDMVRAAAGSFASIAPNPAQYLAARESGWSDQSLRSLLDDNEVTVNVVDPLVNALAGAPRHEEVPDAYQWLFDLTEEDCFRAAHGLGASIVNVAPFLGSTVDEDALSDSLGTLCARAGEHGLSIAVEFMPGTGIPNFEAALRVIEPFRDLGSTVTFDTWHFARSGGRPADLVGLEPGCIGVLQINDRVNPVGSAPYTPMAERLMPGEGELPLAETLAPILRTHPDIKAGLEVFSDRLVGRPAADVARQGATASRGALRAALALNH